MWISRSTETKRRHTFRRPNDWTLVPVGWEGRDAVGEWSGAADIPPPWWDSLGRSGNRLPQFSTGTCCCTNKLTPGLCSNGIQTWCSKTKILFWVFFFFFAFLPSILSFLLLLLLHSADAHSSWRMHFNYPKQTWKYSLFLFPPPVFPHNSVVRWRPRVPPASALTSLTFPCCQTSLISPYLGRRAFSSLSHAFPPSPHLLPLLSLATSSTLLLRRGSELILE